MQKALPKKLQKALLRDLCKKLGVVQAGSDQRLCAWLRGLCKKLGVVQAGSVQDIRNRLVANFEYHTASAGMRRLALLQIGALPPSEVHNLTAADWMALERAGHDVAQLLKAWAAAHAPPDTGACQTGGAPEATAQTNVSLVELCKHQKEELKRLQVALAVQAAGSDRQALLDKINALESANIVLGRDNCQLVAEKDALLSKDICRNNDMLCEKVESWMDLEKCRSEKSELAQTLDDCHTVLSDTRCDLEIERIGRDKTRKLLQQALSVSRNVSVLSA